MSFGDCAVFNSGSVSENGLCYIERVFDGIVSDKDVVNFGQQIQFRLFVADTVGVIDASIYLSDGKNEIVSEKLVNIGNEKSFDAFSAQLLGCDGLGRGLYFYRFELKTAEGILHTDYSDEQIGLSGTKGVPMQLLVQKEIYNQPEWLRSGVIYHIFVDRFCGGGKAEKRDDAVMLGDWYNDIPDFAEEQGGFLANNCFYGGTIYGIISKLDYLKSLGVTCIYLSPIFEAYSNHKYDTGNYLNVDMMFGGNDALKKLIDAAAEKKIGIVLDGVFNHVGDDSVYFNKYGRYDSLGAYQSKESEYSDWFRFTEFPDEYDCWWGIKTLPKAVKDSGYSSFICNSVIPKYIEEGISGWRLDVVDELDSAFVKKIAHQTKRHKADAFLVGEVWEDASNKCAYDEQKYYFCGAELDSVTNYPLRNAIIEFVKFGNSAPLKHVLKIQYMHYPENKLNFLMNFLGTHDTERIITVLAGDSAEGLTNRELSVKTMTEEQKQRGILLLKGAFTLLYTLPGIPCVYYGDEAGMEGYHDPFNRRPFPWGRENEELLGHCRRLGKIRAKYKAFGSGKLNVLNTEDGCIAYTRGTGEDEILVYANFKDEDIIFKSESDCTDLITGKRVARDLTINKQSTVILKKRVKL